MRIAILVLILGLVGCNLSDDDSALQQQISAVPNEATAVQALRAEVSDLQMKISRLQDVGHPRGGSAERTLAIGQAASTISFGPCNDMGTWIGVSNPQSGALVDALTAPFQEFRQCTGYSYGVNVQNGNLEPPNRLFWDGPNCTGNMFTWEAAGAGYNTQTLKNGVVFASPIDGNPLMVQANQTPNMVQVQSAIVVGQPCSPDGDFQPMYSVTPNVLSISGIVSVGSNYQLGPL